MELPYASFEVMEARSTIHAGTAEREDCEKNIRRYPTFLWQLYDHSAGEELATWFFSGKNEFSRQTTKWSAKRQCFQLEPIVYRYFKCLDSQGNYVEK